MKRLLFLAASFLCSLFTYATMTGSGTESDPFMIYTADDLNEVRDYVGVSGLYFKMANDIDLSAYKSGSGWEPIGSSGAQFKGVFDGDGHTITNLKINRSINYVGLFGYATSEIKGVNVECYIEGNYYVGGICGYSTSSIIDCSVSGTITGTGTHIGGICGCGGSITGCSVSGTISGSSDYVGGICASVTGDITKCKVEVNLSGKNYLGGVVGAVNNSMKISICYVESTINATGSYQVGHAGGIVGYNYGGEVSDCVFRGSIISTSNYTGGIIGRNYSSISRCFTETSITSNGGANNNNRVGGICGYSGASVSNCVAANSNITLNNSLNGYYGRIIGENGGNATSNLALSSTKVILGSSEINVTENAKNGTGVSAALLKKKNTYVNLGWDMDGVWGIDEGTSYPYLRYFNPSEEQTLTFETLSLTYGDYDYLLPDETDQGLNLKWTSSDENVASVSGNILTIKGAGSCTLIAEQQGGNGYKAFLQTYPLTVAKAPLTITADNFTRVVGEENPVFTVTYSGFVYDEDESVLKTPPTVTTEATADSPFGDYAITVFGAEADNYDITYVDGTLTVTQAFSLTNTLTVDMPKIRTGRDATLGISLDNEDTMIAFEFYMQLPEGIGIALDEDGYPDVTLNSARSNRHILEVSDDGDGLYHFLCYSNSNNALKGNSGELLSVNIVCDEEMAPQVYQGQIHTVKFSDDAENRILLADVDFDIEVSNVQMADVNDDGDIDVMDVVMMVSHMMGRPSAAFIPAAADHNNDGVIDVMDLVRQVSIVMSQQVSQAPASHNFDAIGSGLSLATNQDGAVQVSLSDGMQYVATQFVVILSEGQQLSSVTTDRRHTVDIQPLTDNRYFVMSYSVDNETFAASDQVLTLYVTGRGTVTVEDATFVDADLRKVAFQSASMENTGINELTLYPSSPTDIYSPNGILMRRNASTTENLPNGMYIINGKKHIKK